MDNIVLMLCTIYLFAISFVVIRLVFRNKEKEDEKKSKSKKKK